MMDNVMLEILVGTLSSTWQKDASPERSSGSSESLRGWTFPTPNLPMKGAGDPVTVMFHLSWALSYSPEKHLGSPGMSAVCSGTRSLLLALTCSAQCWGPQRLLLPLTYLWQHPTLPDALVIWWFGAK